MILHVTLNVNLNETADPANIITRCTETLTNAVRSVEEITAFQITSVAPEDDSPPLEAPASTTPEVTIEDV
ncbi:hypothetical protein SEA_BIG4_91 [Microbacterium phage Big4]|nr:hypothetical protein SEA_BIG4_91 [Microbacterium phage Big4]